MKWGTERKEKNLELERQLSRKPNKTNYLKIILSKQEAF